MSTLKAGKLQHPDAANSSIEFDSSGNITKFVGPSGGADGNVLTKSGTAPAWTSAGAVGGLVLITSQSFSAASSVSVDNCFSATYEAYRIVVNIPTNSTTAQLQVRLRNGGSDRSTNYYSSRTFHNSVAGTETNTYQNNTNILNVTGTVASAGYHGSLDIVDVFAARFTSIMGFSYQPNDGSGNMFLASHLSSVSNDGISFIASAGTITGTVRIYGYRN